LKHQKTISLKRLTFDFQAQIKIFPLQNNKLPHPLIKSTVKMILLSPIASPKLNKPRSNYMKVNSQKGHQSAD
jgi:hypothetical protein